MTSSPREETMDDSDNSSNNSNKDTMFHVIHKLPYGDGPYVRAKHAQVLFLSLISFFDLHHLN